VGSFEVISRGESSFAPDFLLSRMTAISPAGREGPESGMDGCIAPEMNFTARLSSGAPETNAEPRLPPAWNPA